MLNFIHLSTLAIFTYANLIQNGDFENAGEFCDKGFCVLTDEAAIAPWKLATGSEFEVDGSVWPAKSGSWSMDLSANNPYSITQNFDTTSGTEYVLVFHVNKNTKCDINIDRTGEFNIGGFKKVSFIHTKGSTEWFKIVQYFTATDSSTSLTIGSTTTGSCGPVIDNVSVELV
jgi:hypothetical protein